MLKLKMTLHFRLTLDEDGRWRQHKYLLYVASADALANRRRRGENVLHVVCLSAEGDHLSMRLTSLIKPMNSTH